jgi:hypothetical protein
MEAVTFFLSPYMKTKKQVQKSWTNKNPYQPSILGKGKKSSMVHTWQTARQKAVNWSLSPRAETKETKHKRVGQMKSLPSISGKDKQFNQKYIYRSQHDTEAVKPLSLQHLKFRPMLLTTQCIVLGVDLVCTLQYINWVHV